MYTETESNMSNMSEYKINALPAKTWYWLNLNDAKLTWDSEVKPCSIETDGYVDAFYDTQTDDYADISDSVKTGSGEAADALFVTDKVKPLVINADKGADNKTLYISIDDSSVTDNKLNQSGKLIVNVEDGVTFTIIETFRGREEISGNTAFRTLIDAGRNSCVRLVQVFLQPQKQTVLSDIGSRCAQASRFELVQLFLGEGNLYDGIRTDLIGDKSEFVCDIGYFGADKQNIDINLISNHIGKKTNCVIGVDGALKDAARKTFKGTIDFKNGSSGSTGVETENVLLLGDDVVNKTIPVILCAEEDVNGSHGATIGELDAETLFYFAARGIDSAAAEDIMTKGRLEVIVRKIADEKTEQLANEHLRKVLKEVTLD